MPTGDDLLRCKAGQHSRRHSAVKLMAALMMLLTSLFLVPQLPVEATSIVATIAVGQEPQGVAVNPVTNRIYVTNGLYYVTVIDGATNAVIATVTTGGDYAIAIAVNTTTNRIYVTNLESGNVSVIDGTLNTLTTTIDVGENPTGIAVNPSTNRIYVVNSGPPSSISVIDGSTNTVVSTINIIADMFSGIAVNPVTNRFYTGIEIDGLVSVRNGVNNSEIGTVAAGVSPTDIAVNPVTNRIYVANWVSNDVTVIDGSTDTVSATIPVGTRPGSVAVNTYSNMVYVANWLSSTLSVINGADNTLVFTVPLVLGPASVAVNTNTGLIYVSNKYSNVVSVLAEMPMLFLVAPDHGAPGQAMQVTVTGSNFTQGTALDFGQGIAVSNVSVVSPTQVTATLTIAAGAAPGSRDVSVTTPGGTGTGRSLFTISSTVPTVTSVTPGTGRRGETIALVITGSNFTGATSVSFGAGIAVTFTVASPTQINASITISPAVEPGTRDVSVTTAGGTATGTSIFSVLGGSQFVGSGGDGSAGSGGAGAGQGTQGIVPVALPNIVVQSATISAERVAPGEPVTVSASLVNRGTASGTAKVKVYVNGEEEVPVQGVTVNGGSIRPVSFIVSRNEPGTYTVNVNGTSAGSFTVETVAPGTILWISGGMVLIALVGGLIYTTRRITGR